MVGLGGGGHRAAWRRGGGVLFPPASASHGHRDGQAAMRPGARRALASSLLASLVAAAQAPVRTRSVMVEGVASIAGDDVATAREAAVRNAQRAALEQVVGVH